MTTIEGVVYVSCVCMSLADHLYARRGNLFDGRDDESVTGFEKHHSHPFRFLFKERFR